jgi:hypothetical protein
MRSKLWFLLLFYWMFSSYPASAQVIDTTKRNSKKSTMLLKDSSEVQLRKFDEELIAKYAKQQEFIYDDVPEPKANWWQRFWRWFWSLLDGVFDGNNYSPFLKFGLVALVIAGVTFLIIKILGLDLGILTGKSKKVVVPYEESLENIHEINFDDQLYQALAQKNYRLAVRLLYLRTLKNLTDKQLIYWQPEKTNQTYVAELENEQHQHAFRGLTNQFEYIWYGEFNIDENVFSGIDKSFQQFNQQMR